MENNTLKQTAIESLIYEIRGQKVMLDRDLARLYGVSTGNLNKAVKRNIERFPERYMFQLTSEENLKFQNGISSWGAPVPCHMLLQSKELLCFLRYCIVRLPFR